eukprot:6183308-Pleurochrysis_carterae.AAC.1
MEWTAIPDPSPDPAPPPDQARAQEASQTNVRAKWARKDHETDDGRLSCGSYYASFAAHASRSLLGAIFSPTKAQSASANSSSGHAAFSPAEHAAHASFDAANTTTHSIKPAFPPSQTCERESPSRTHTDADIQGSESPTPENVEPFTAKVDAETRAPAVGLNISENGTETELEDSDDDDEALAARFCKTTYDHPGPLPDASSQSDSNERMNVKGGDLAADMDEVEEMQEHDEKDDDAW